MFKLLENNFSLNSKINQNKLCERELRSINDNKPWIMWEKNKKTAILYLIITYERLIKLLSKQLCVDL